MRTLLVEDDASIRTILQQVAHDHGMPLLAAADADEGRVLLEANPDIQLLITDVVMPGSMNGLQLAHLARRLRPELAVIVITGYARSGTLPDGAILLKKPFRPSRLLELIEAMGGRDDDPSPLDS